MKELIDKELTVNIQLLTTRRYHYINRQLPQAKNR
jgi:hypothetical protein